MYEFNGLLTRYLRNLGVEGELLNNRIVVGTYIIDLSQTNGLTVAHGPVLTMPKCQAQNNEIITQIYGLQLLQLSVLDCPSTHEEIQAIERDYSFSPHASTKLYIGPKFIKPVDDDVPTNKDLNMCDSDME